MKKSLILGAHISVADGFPQAIQYAEAIGATTMQIFTANQRQWHHKALDEEVCQSFIKALHHSTLSHVMSHDSYLINLGSPREDVQQKSVEAMKSEIERCFQLQLSALNFHPGAALAGSKEECLERIVKSLLSFVPLFHGREDRLQLLIETMAGQGSVVGGNFSDIQYIIDRTKSKVPIGVCLDTCHSFAAGYDLRSKDALKKTLEEFDQIIGLDMLKALHLNDSQKGLGSHVDRHVPLGEGMIGKEGFQAIVCHPVLSKLPMYLETPGGLPLWENEIAWLRSCKT